MSLITRCPACETMFRVVPDQLRISDGWVRCGKCNEAFEASAHLVELPTPAQEEAASVAALQPVAPEQVLQEQAPSVPAPAVLQVAEAPDEPLSFMPEQADTEGAFWKRPLTRLGLALAAVALCFGLLMQVWLQERDRLLSEVPGARLVLRYICQPLGCSVWLPRQIDAILIDGASFNKVEDAVFQLRFTLRNTVPVDLALPAFELTLTDSLDQPFMRRVLRASELELGNKLLRAGAELNGKATLALDFPAGAPALSGYRLVAFYP